MTKGTADRLIQKICEYRPLSLNILFQGGEPTLAGIDFFRYFTKNVKRDISVPINFGLQSNGILIDNDFAKFFRENDYLIGISLDGNRKTNDRYRHDIKENSVFPEILEGISFIRKNHVDFNILSVIDDKNAADFSETWRYFQKHDFGFLQFIPYIDEGNNLLLSVDSYEHFLKSSFDLWYEEWEKGNYISVRHIDNYIRILMGDRPENCAMCGTCGNYFVIEANGDLFPCDFYCTEDYRLGSIFDKEPFAENTKQKEFIAQSKIIHESCRKCKYYFLCRGGCRRDRIENLTENRYCNAYKNFFDYTVGRMKLIAQSLMQSSC